jgi:hypothetical protein
MNSMDKLRNKWKKNGLCRRCGKRKAKKGKTKCQECINTDVIYQRERRHKNRDLGLCITCGNPAMVNTETGLIMKCCSKCSEIKNINERKNRKLLKIKVLSYYSKGEPKCACCGEKELDFLSVDHINGGGNKHHKTFELSSTCGGNICRWVKRNNYPPGFRVLCMNCNFAIGAFGSCPHQRLSRQKSVSLS